MTLTFSGTRALILGGSCELALALGSAMIDAYLFPILTYRSEAGLSAIHRALAHCQGKFDTMYLSLGDQESIKNLPRFLGDELDYLVDFAQGNYENLIAAADEDAVHRYFMHNVSARAEILKLAGRIMLKKKRGRLIFISSAAAVQPNPGQGFYAAAKLASEALYRTLGVELGSRGITTVVLRPGYIDTGRGREFLSTQGRKILTKIPIQRALTAEEVAMCILYLMSDVAHSINATVITMDGGLTSTKGL